MMTVCTRLAVPLAELPAWLALGWTECWRHDGDGGPVARGAFAVIEKVNDAAK